MNNTNERPLKITELFAGIGAQAAALERLGIPFKSVVCEIDQKAYAGYCAIHGWTPNLGDITKVEHLEPCDLITYSFPCQDLSVAGNQKGMTEGSGTRSGLLWEVGRLLQDMREREALPEYLLMENVDAILNKKNIEDFKRWIQVLTDMGYRSTYKVLNAKDYGIPQSRKRCFMISTLHKGVFTFPEPKPLELRLKDLLEHDVAENYYLSEERIAKYEAHRIRQEENGRGFGWPPLDPEVKDIAKTFTGKETRHTGNFIIDNPNVKVVGSLNIPGRYESACRVYGSDGIAPTLPTAGGGGIIPKIDATGKEEDAPHLMIKALNKDVRAEDGDGIVTTRPYSTYAPVIRSPTLTCGPGCGTGATVKAGDQLRIRYLTPRECGRLMGFNDDQITKIAEAIPSKTGQYKVYGNCIVVDVLAALFENMFIKDTFKKRDFKQSTLF